jgi:hypothetical protein
MWFQPMCGFGPAIRAQQAEAAAHDASAKAREARSETEAIRMDIERLLMIAEALWEMLKAEHGYTDAQLAQRIQDIDLRDGRLDGRVARQRPPNCPKCGRTAHRRRPVCLYCGAPLPQDPFQR